MSTVDTISQIVGSIAFVVVLIQAVRHRTAHQSMLDAVAQAQAHAERAASGAAAAASQAAQVLIMMQPHADALAKAVERLPVKRAARATDPAAGGPQ